MAKRKVSLIALLLALVMVVSSAFVACGGGEDPVATQYTVTFDSDGGTAVGSQTVDAGSNATKPQDPTKTDNIFAGWQLNGVAYDFNAAVNANITLKAAWIVDLNETKPLVLQTSTLDGVFNPFFASSAYDVDVYNMVNVSLLINDAAGTVVAGDEYATVAKSYDVTLNEEDGSATYEFVLKNNLKFSDGTPITADDVLFNYYVLLDPKYDGNTTMYTLPIKGLAEYRNQTTPEKAAEFGALADIAWELGYGLTEEEFDAAFAEVETDYELSYADYQAYWSDDAIQAAGEKFAQDIVNYVVSNYASYVPTELHPAIGSMNDTQKVALGMALWGFGARTSGLYSEDANGEYVLLEDVYEAYDEEAEYDETTAYYNMVAYNLAEGLEGAYAVYRGTFYNKAVLDRNGIEYTETYDLVENPDYDERDTYAAYNMVATDYDDWGNQLVGDYVKVQSAGYVEYDAEEHAGMTRYALNPECIFETDPTGLELNILSDSAVLTVADYWDALVAAYEGDYATLSGVEAANLGLEDCLKEIFVPYMAQKGEGAAVESISGITKGTKTIDGVEYETVTVVCTSQSPKTILNLGVTVTPKAYYTEGFNYTEGAIINAGVEFNNANFMAHLKTKNSVPVGAGAYKFVSYANNVVEFTRNENFASFGLGNAKIKTVRMQVISGGQEYDAVKTGAVHYSTVSATADVVSQVATINNLTPILVDNLGYGYICINPAVYPNLNTRIALQKAFDMSLVYEYYPNGLAEVIYRSMSKIHWAYPEDAEALYDYDVEYDDNGNLVAESLESIKNYLEQAGYTFSGNTMIDPATGEQAIFEFNIPSGASDHPAGKIFQNAKTILDALGAKARVKVDTNLIKNIKAGKTGVYALAWSSTIDPDMTQVYGMNSQADSVTANGIKYITANPDKFGAEAGTITFKGVEYTQYEALVELSRLIAEGLKHMKEADRKPIYGDALDILAELVIEVPTYQRKNLFVYDNTVIDSASLSEDITPYWGPMAEMWNVSFVQGK